MFEYLGYISGSLFNVIRIFAAVIVFFYVIFTLVKHSLRYLRGGGALVALKTLIRPFLAAVGGVLVAIGLHGYLTNPFQYPEMTAVTFFVIGVLIALFYLRQLAIVPRQLWRLATPFWLGALLTFSYVYVHGNLAGIVLFLLTILTGTPFALGVAVGVFLLYIRDRSEN